MLLDDISWTVDEIGQLWPYFVTRATEAQQRAIVEGLKPIRLDRKQIRAVLDEHYRTKPGGFPDIAKLLAGLRNASGERARGVASGTQMSDQEKRARLEELITWAAGIGGTEVLLRDYPDRNLYPLRWCRMAIAMGMDLIGIVAKAVRKPPDQVHRELMQLIQGA